MKSISHFIIILFIGNIVLGQHQQFMLPNGGGEFKFEKNGPCLSDEKRSEIRARLERKVKELKGKDLYPIPSNKSFQGFTFPLKASTLNPYNNYYTISGFVDHNSEYSGSQFGDTNRDYFCGNRTYDTTDGYNHAGTDYALWPFSWYQYEAGLVDAVSVSKGLLLDKEDGNKDDDCYCEGEWNAVYVQHEDGSIGWYGHLKKGSLVDKQFGDAIEQGEYLGKIASSGCSSGPHLHFELYHDGDLIDPYSGNCNMLNTESYWAEQPQYFEPQINALLTHYAPPVFGCTPSGEEINAIARFDLGDEIIFAAYYKDQRASIDCEYTIYRPDGSVYTSWTHNSPEDYSSSYWYWTIIIDEDIPGMWDFEVKMGSKVEKITFRFTENTTSTNELNGETVNVFPNPAKSSLIIQTNAEISAVELFDLTGKIVYRSLKVEIIDVSAFENGSYFLKVVDTDGKSQLEKIVIIH